VYGTENGPLNDYPAEGKDGNLTNVLKLHILAGGNVEYDNDDYQRFKDEGQITLYQLGIGAKEKKDVDGVNDRLDKAGNTAEFFLGDINTQVEPMKERLGKVYEEGDKLVICGFSRGAASARKFNAVLCSDGLMLANGEVIKSPEVELLAVWDTVSMQIKDYHLMGIINWQFRRHPSTECMNEKGGKLPPNVKKAVHLVALDDCRMWEMQTFPPTLMDSSDDRVTEMYFPGVHADVGGGYGINGLSDGACAYMKKYLEQAGLKFLEFNDVEDDALVLSGVPDINISQNALKIDPNLSNQANIGDGQRVKRPSSRPICSAIDDKWIFDGGTAKIHESVVTHLKKRKSDGKRYFINQHLYSMGFVVVGESGEDLCKELPEKTKELKEFLEEEKACGSVAIVKDRQRCCIS